MRPHCPCCLILPVIDHVSGSTFFKIDLPMFHRYLLIFFILGNGKGGESIYGGYFKGKVLWFMVVCCFSFES